MRNRIIPVVLLVSATAACGSADNVIHGTYQGQPFPEVRSAVSAYSEDPVTHLSSLVILLSSSKNLCQSLERSQNPSADHVLAIQVAAPTDQFPLLSGVVFPVPSEFTVRSHAQSAASVEFTDRSCVPMADTVLQATVGPDGERPGTVVNAAKGGGYQGSFDLLFSNGDKLSGSFNTEPCDPAAVLAKLNDSPALACK